MSPYLAAAIGYTLGYQSFPAVFWDLFGEQGTPVRTTVTETWFAGRRVYARD